MTELEFYNTNGYVLLKSFFKKEEIDKVHKEAKGIFLRQFIQKQYVPKGTTVDSIAEQDFNNCMYRLFEEDITCLSNCGKQVQHLISLHVLSLDERIQKKLSDLGVKSPVISTRPVMFFNHPRLAKAKVFHTVDAHQDWRSMQGSLNAIVVWIPLIDVGLDLGALQVLPGSHRKGLLTDHIDSGFGMVTIGDDDKFISVEVEQGDALFFSSFLVHQSGENVSAGPRWSCHFRYNDLDEPSFIERKYAHPYIYKPGEELITPGFPKLEDIERVFN